MSGLKQCSNRCLISSGRPSNKQKSPLGKTATEKTSLLSSSRPLQRSIILIWIRSSPSRAEMSTPTHVAGKRKRASMYMRCASLIPDRDVNSCRPVWGVSFFFCSLSLLSYALRLSGHRFLSLNGSSSTCVTLQQRRVLFNRDSLAKS